MSPQPLRILVIEDFDLLRAAVIRLLEHRGYTAEGAADGQAGLEAIARRVNVSTRTISRWLGAGHAPHPMFMEALRRLEANRARK